MKKIIYLLAFFASAGLNTALGQYHNTIKLEKGCKLLKSMNVPDALVLLTGTEDYLTKKLNWKINCFASNMTQRYQLPVPNSDIKTLADCFLISSPTGNNVYLVTHGGNKQTILHIDSSGNSNTIELKDEFEYDRTNVIFADDNYLYFVTKEPDKAAVNKHAFPKLQFVRVGKDKSVTKVMLALPEPEPYATGWSYFGHTDVVSYFVSRDLDDESYMDEKFRIAVIGHDGQLLDDFRIDARLSSGKLMPEYNYCGTEGVSEVNNHNIKVGSGSENYYNENGPKTSGSVAIYSPYPEAYGNIMLDPATNGFYVYGIAGSGNLNAGNGSKKDDNLMPTDFYVYGYDPDGKALWSYEEKLTGIDEYFKNKASFLDRQVTLKFGPGGNLRFQAFALKDVATYEMDRKTGNFITSYTNTFPDLVKPIDLAGCHKSTDKSELNNFLSQPKKGAYNDLVFRMENSSIVVRNFDADSRLEMYDFGDE